MNVELDSSADVIEAGHENRKSESPHKAADFEYVNRDGDLLEPQRSPSPPVMVSSQVNTDEFDPLTVKPQELRGNEPKHSSVDDLINLDSIQTGVDNVHDEIDSVLNRISPVPPVSNQPVEDIFFGDRKEDKETKEEEAEAGEDVTNLDFGKSNQFYGVHVRDEEPEETFERSGPLTIPADAIAKNLEDALAESIVSNSIAEAAEKSTKPAEEEPKIEASVPRAPTPPKDISDEKQQPSSLDLGPPPVAHSQADTEHPKSILKHAGTGPWFDLEFVDPRIKELIYWRDPKKSGVVLSLLLLVLIFAAKMSLISFISNAGLLLLSTTLGYRAYTMFQARMKKTVDVNPFEPLLQEKIAVPTERIHQQADKIAQKLSTLLTHLRHLLLVENISDSLKFGLLLWAVSFVGRLFSGMCLIFLAVIGVFTIPKFYEVYKVEIDEHLHVAEGHLKKLRETLEEKIPFLKQKMN
ncbi:hypothetical protein L596_014970 [Steinernema carpocapsae]|uniref:Reticulon-like protein n=1 Tax=Steinernema carpocapsae TaxID=34508 RepID=A0A4U5NEH9_STECR|nr:hypothetical protein L596_014970 [Steinernema carpocapsae]